MPRRKSTRRPARPAGIQAMTAALYQQVRQAIRAMAAKRALRPV